MRRIFLDNGLDGLDGFFRITQVSDVFSTTNEANKTNFFHAARRSMARSTFGATNDTNEISVGNSHHAVDIREIRCRLRLREISLYQHGYKNSSHSSHSLLEKTVWNIRNLSYPKKSV